MLLDVYDVHGGLVARDRSLIDMRNMDAGTYYARVHRPAAAATSALPFTFTFAAPPAGQTRPLDFDPDRDELRGGDGNDTLIGNQDVDRLFGEAGADRFVADASMPASCPLMKSRISLPGWTTP